MRKHITITSILLLMLVNLNAAVINNNITTDLVWTCGDSWQNSNDVTIEAGITLTINNCNTFSFPNNLILKDGANITINNSTVTINSNKAIKLKKNSRVFADNSYFTGSLWQGFIFDNTVLSGTDLPGAIKLTYTHVNSAIEVFKGIYGGSIYATNSKFYDFSKFLHLANYSYQNKSVWDRCFFWNCDIYNTACINPPGGYINDTWISLSNVPQTYIDGNNETRLKGKGTRFVNCKFLNVCSDIFNCFDAISSTLEIKGCTFSGFPEGSNKDGTTIYLMSNAACQEMYADIDGCSFKPYTYNYSDFTNTNSGTINYESCRKAISIVGCASAQIISNDIVLESYGNKRHGIFLGGCSGFKLEDNTITATASSGNPVETYGIIIEDANDQTNQVYRNHLIYCHYGISAQGKNRGTAPYNLPAQGLKFLCNDFTSFDNAYYMRSVKKTLSTSADNNSISKFQQGALSVYSIDESPNFNKTTYRSNSSGDYDFHVNSSLTGFDITYMQPTSPGTDYTLTHYLLNNAITVSTDQSTSSGDDHCESRLPTWGPASPVTISPVNIGNIYPVYTAYQLSLKNMVNNGDHDYLYNLVSSVTESNVSKVYDELMNSTPSHNILALACANSIFTNSMVEDILVTNSYGIKSGEVREALRIRDSQLDQVQMENIYSAAENISEYERLMMQVDNMNSEYMRLMNESISILSRRDSVPIDSIKLYLIAIGDFYSYIKLIDYEFREGELTQAQSLFDNISETTTDQEEINTYSTLYNDVLLDIYSNHDGDFTMLSSSQRTVLYSLINGTTYTAWIAKFLLATYDEYEWVEEYYPNENQNGERRANPALDSNTGTIKLYPNPAQNIIIVEIVELDMNEVQFVITDLSGKIVYNQNINKSLSTLDISNLQNGVYLIKATFGGQIETSKLIINK